MQERTTGLHKRDQQIPEKSDKERLANISGKYGVVFRNGSKQKNGNTVCEIKQPDEGVKVKSSNKNKLRFAGNLFREAGIKARFVNKIQKILDDRMTVKQIFNRYIENSTLHGFRFIFMDTFITRRVLWTILTVSMASLFFNELNNSINLYLQYPFTTTSTMRYIETLAFPAISICSLNSLLHPRIHNNIWHLYERALLPSHYHDDHDDTAMPDIPGDKLREVLKATSPPFSKIFQSCEWKSRDTAKTGVPNVCIDKNFTTYINLHGETCYTFNGENALDLLSLNKTGLDIGLKLEFDLKIRKSLPLQEIGLRVIVHDQNETPLQQAGFVVSPGFHSIVELKVRKTQNLHEPYATKCDERPLAFFKNYRQSKCFLEKLTKDIQRKCKCHSLFMDALDWNSGYPACSLNETVNCLLPMVDGFDRKTNIECPLDCESTTYGISLSTAKFIPSSSFKTTTNDGRSSYIMSLQTKMNGSELDRYVEENVVVLQFFYQEMKEENVVQEESYDHYKLIGDVGGQLGLLLGASVLTLVEFVDLFFFTLYHQLLRLYRRKTPREPEVS